MLVGGHLFARGTSLLKHEQTAQDEQEFSEMIFMNHDTIDEEDTISEIGDMSEHGKFELTEDEKFRIAMNQLSILPRTQDNQLICYECPKDNNPCFGCDRTVKDCRDSGWCAFARIYGYPRLYPREELEEFEYIFQLSEDIDHDESDSEDSETEPETDSEDDALDDEDNAEDDVLDIYDTFSQELLNPTYKLRAIEDTKNDAKNDADDSEDSIDQELLNISWNYSVKSTGARKCRLGSVTGLTIEPDEPHEYTLCTARWRNDEPDLSSQSDG